MLKYFSFPSAVIIEGINACNAHCVMCPIHINPQNRGVMDWDLFVKIIDECAQYAAVIDAVHLYMNGEPLLDPLLAPRIRYARKNGLFTVISTNGALLNISKIEEIVESGLNEIIISLDGATRETYQRVRQGLDFRQVVNNTHQLIAYKRSCNVPVRIVVKMIAMPETMNEIDDFRTYWQPQADEVRVTRAFSWGKYQAPDNKTSVPIFAFHKPCVLPWTQMVILANGDVALCCLDHAGQVKLGNAREQSLAEVWRGAPLKRVRWAHVTGQFEQFPMCKHCDFRGILWENIARKWLRYDVLRNFLGNLFRLAATQGHKETSSHIIKST